MTRRNVTYVSGCFSVHVLLKSLPTFTQSHSEVPQEDKDWPTSFEIHQFQVRVRARLLKLYDDIKSAKITMTRKIARVLFMTFEHEAEHAETLLYMLLQRAGTGTVPPPGFAVPPWSSLATTWDSARPLEAETVTLGPALVSLGHDDAEAGDASLDVDHEFGWDNEHPKRNVQVERFEISWRPVTNAQFYEFYLGEGKDKVQLPKSWVQEDGGEIKVDFRFTLFNCKNFDRFVASGPYLVWSRAIENRPALARHHIVQRSLYLCDCQGWSASD